jgi:hypothetical protein
MLLVALNCEQVDEHIVLVAIHKYCYHICKYYRHQSLECRGTILVSVMSGSGLRPYKCLTTNLSVILSQVKLMS